MVSAEKIRAVHEIIENGRFWAVYQPIVDVRSRRVFGYESLLRTKNGPFSGPIELYETAVSAGRVGELGRRFREQAVAQCPRWPLFLNLFPNEFDYGWLVRPDDPIFRHRWPVYLEITESVPLNYFEQCHNILAEVRKRGALLAIDDLGAGYSNLRYIADLVPEIVKLDRVLVAGAREDTRQFELLRSIVDLCKGMGAMVVAEGIETAEELRAVVAAGVTYCQGYLLGRPASLPSEPVWP